LVQGIHRCVDYAVEGFGVVHFDGSRETDLPFSRGQDLVQKRLAVVP
jgi:hypothetical protein